MKTSPALEAFLQIYTENDLIEKFALFKEGFLAGVEHQKNVDYSDINKYMNLFCKRNNLNLSLILSNSRQQHICLARQALHYYLHSILIAGGRRKFSLNEIATATIKNHSTVLHSIKTVDNQIKTTYSHYKF
jgi:chromosomal replication initiation ATPase DnaA